MSQFGYAIRQLSAAQKSAKGVSLYSRYVNRPAGRVLAAASYGLKLTPNQITMISAVFTFAGVVMIAVLRPSPAAAAGIFAALVLGFALDSADGQLARLTGTGSAAGEWLDHVVDCAKMLALHMAVLVSFYRYFGFSDPRYLLLPVAFQFAAVVVFFGGILTEQLKRADRLRSGAGGPAPSAPASTLRSVALLPVDYGVFCALFLLFGSQDLFLAMYCVLLAAHLLFMVAFLVKWYRELSAPGR
ncbi:CDP-alcohol phosphatidyltransferase family protein [Streptomyces sp. Isolate_219]|uniref:CDP-alcohol phosphatidyltransferase family protein n=1 Tax=Streptomyces sp. Isolate_219 TaxID=2950110 RepID=UPI0021C869B4|nr:CDP-alcohol phosphatidyltransferase family protein [Streptomyces sp. Isolate_219]MCR8573965.1 CDP-alcohol phosphatidyltransferase family protein [Streptomyces sp. Isolate_219]